MAKQVRFSIDLDGVVANFNKALTALAQELQYAPTAQQTGKEGGYELVPDTDRIDAWIEGHLEEFWGNLETMASENDMAAIRRAQAQGHELFWVSARPSHRMRELRRISREWLQKNGFPVDEAHLLLGPNKASNCKHHGITNHLDDRVSHAIHVALSGTSVYLIVRPWNIEELRYSGYTFQTVDSIEEYITLVTAGA